jgi:hypothetical protein
LEQGIFKGGGKMKRVMIVALCILAVSAMVVGCSGRSAMSDEPLTNSSSEPLWVSQGIRAFPDQVGKSIGGVGIAEKRAVPLINMRRTTAIDRAQGEVARTLRVVVESVFKDYSEAAFTESMDEGAARQIVSRVQKTIVDEVLHNCEVVNTWKDPNTGDFYAFTVLSTDGLAQRLRAKIVALEKDRLRVDAAVAHKDLDTIIEKHRNRASGGK